MQHTVDVIVLTYKPPKGVLQLIEMIEKQDYPIQKLILMNTEEKYFDERFYGTGFLEKYNNIEVHHISGKEFDHGRTRNRATAYSNADIFVCMTQDAIPADTALIGHLVEALQQPKVAAAYARQLPLPDCREIEKYTRSFNYPEESRIKSKDDIAELGIKTFFCSNVCAAYNRNIFDMLGGFEKRAIFNEDMIYAGHAVEAGYRIAYQAQAQVYHSHNYSCMQQFRRNFDLGVSQAEHPEIFEGVPSEGEGMRLVKKTLAYLIHSGRIWLIPGFVLQCAGKYAGYLAGKKFRKLPKKFILWCSGECNDSGAI